MRTKEEVMELIDRSVDTEGAFEAITPRLRRGAGSSGRPGVLLMALVALVVGAGVLVVRTGNVSDAPVAGDHEASTTAGEGRAPPREATASVLADHPFGSESFASALVEREDGSLVALVHTPDGLLESWVSTDGSDWTVAGVISEDFALSRALLEVDRTLVALVEDPGGVAMLWRSTDGADWTSTPLASVRSAYPTVATPGGLAVGGSTMDGPAVWLGSGSGSGVDIVQLSSGDGEVGGLAVDGDRLVAVGADADGARSWVVDLDTREVDRSGVPIPTGRFFWGVTFDGAVHVAVGVEDGRPAVWTSVDGLVWQSVETRGLPTEPGHRGLAPVVSTEIGLVGLGLPADTDASAGALWYSPDGVSWNVVLEPPDPMGGNAFTSALPTRDGNVLVGGPSIVQLTLDTDEPVPAGSEHLPQPDSSW